MGAELNVSIGDDFPNQLRVLANQLRGWSRDVEVRLERAMRIIAMRFEAEAKKRVPVDTGNLRQRILSEVYKEAGQWVAACGTNVPYGKFLEFGNRYIAGGQVEALGDGVEIDDSMAVKDWPAKSADHNGHTLALQAFASAAGSPEEQMPWLRPSLMAIKPWAMQLIAEAIIPPNISSAQ